MASVATVFSCDIDTFTTHSLVAAVASVATVFSGKIDASTKSRLLSRILVVGVSTVVVGVATAPPVGVTSEVDRGEISEAYKEKH